MGLLTITLLIVAAITAEEMWTHRSLHKRLANAWLKLQTSFLPATHITLDHTQIGHIIPVNDDLLLIRHASGRLVYLPTRRPAQSLPAMPEFVKALVLIFFSLV